MKYFTLCLLSLILLRSPCLFSQTDDSWKLYSDSAVGRVDVTVDPTTLSWIYSHVESDSEHYAQVRVRTRWFDETVDSIGFRLRGNTSRYSGKKSFKISFNTFIKGRTFHGVKKLNLNGEHNDPSIIRSKLCFDLYNEIGVPASRAAHFRVYINGAYYGLYISVEHLGEEFLTKNYADDNGNLWKCLYPADLQYLGNDPATYANLISDGRPVYELQTNESDSDFTQIARLTRVLNTTPAAAMADSLESVLDAPTILQYFAMNILTGSWDDYRSLMNNYYLYHIPSENKFTLIPYDYDNTYGIDWSGNNWTIADPYNFPKVVGGPRPLSEALLGQNHYRDLFTHFLSFYNATVFPLSRWEWRIDRLRDSISAAAIEDTYRTLDYGFTADDFFNSYSADAYQNQHVKFGIKQFVNLRRASLPGQLSYTGAAAQAYRVGISPKQPGPEDTITVTAACFGSAGVRAASVLYTPKDSVTAHVYPMQFSPVSGTLRAEEADRWIASIPPLGPAAAGTIRIRVEDSLNRVVTYPRTGGLTVQTPQIVSQGTLVINEIMADNGTVLADQNGEYDDWLEIYNPTTETRSLTGLYLSDNLGAKTKWQFTQPGLTIGPREHLLIWCDDQVTQEGMHASFKFSAGGEAAVITDADGVTILDSVTFGAQSKNVTFGRYPSAGALWGKMSPTPRAANTAPTGTGTLSVSMVQGWNLLAVPFAMAETNPGAIFPEAVSHAFAYGGRYVRCDTALPGTGFWMKFPGAMQRMVTGISLAADTIAVQEGWNMVGGISMPVPVASLVALTPGLTLSPFYGYNDGYAVAGTIIPGAGYWVKANKAGVIRVAGNSYHYPITNNR